MINNYYYINSLNPIEFLLINNDDSATVKYKFIEDNIFRIKYYLMKYNYTMELMMKLKRFFVYYFNFTYCIIM